MALVPPTMFLISLVDTVVQFGIFVVLRILYWPAQSVVVTPEVATLLTRILWPTC